MAVGAYKNITTSTTTNVSLRTGVLLNVTVNNPGSTWTIAIWDGPVATGQLIGTISPETAGGGQFGYEVGFGNGLVIVTSGTTAGDITVSYT